VSTKDYSGERAYDSEIASSYEEVRKVERIWGLEQTYMKRIVQEMPEGSSLLDIPVGTGRFLGFYEARKLNVLGIDISASMLAESKSKALSPRTRLELGDARALSVGDASVDYVICWRLLHLLPPNVLRAVVGELSRVAAKRMYLQAYVRDRWYYFLWLKITIRRIFEKLSDGNQPSRTPWSHIQSYAHGEPMMLQIFSDCGLSLGAVDRLGSYGSLSLKVYVLNKA
jgi:ubiquinone/menaquinone biosynthesis C-methylase UbiE